MRRGKYGTLIVLYPRFSFAVYLDSGSNEKKKNYALIRSVLDDALNGYVFNEGLMDRPHLFLGKNVFRHKTEFPCTKQAPGGEMEAWYLIQHMQDYVKDQQRLQYPSALEIWCNGISDWDDATIRQNFGRIQQTIARIIYRDVLDRDGIFYNGAGGPRSNDEILRCIVDHGDVRPFNSLEGALPFPPLPKPKK